MGDTKIRTDLMVEINIDAATTENVHRYTFYSTILYEQFLERGALPSEIEHQRREFEDQMNKELAYAMLNIDTMFIIGEKSSEMKELRPDIDYNQVYIPGVYHWVVMDVCKYMNIRGYTRIIPVNENLVNAPPIFMILNQTDLRCNTINISDSWNEETVKRLPWFKNTSVMGSENVGVIDLYAGETAGFAEGFNDLKTKGVTGSCHD